MLKCHGFFSDCFPCGSLCASSFSVSLVSSSVPVSPFIPKCQDRFYIYFTFKFPLVSFCFLICSCIQEAQIYMLSGVIKMTKHDGLLLSVFIASSMSGWCLHRSGAVADRCLLLYNGLTQGQGHTVRHPLLFAF